jgi:hypothetical protein
MIDWSWVHSPIGASKTDHTADGTLGGAVGVRDQRLPCFFNFIVLIINE